MIQFMSPLLLLGMLLNKGGTFYRRFTRSTPASAEGLEGGEGMVNLELVERGEGWEGAITLGGGGGVRSRNSSNPRSSKFRQPNPLRDAPPAAGIKNKADAGRPNSSFDVFKNPSLKGAFTNPKSKNKKKNGGVVVAKLENEIIQKGEAIAIELARSGGGGKGKGSNNGEDDLK
ncbi:hypothetical protein TrVE_jg161 [Triparma verrucosa]|uniref:Uncharacterized protein n=1 Tax=Triparma verrucosa TaxID=1606542 RepID=A0A9W7CKR5_9STRA|nr:hypothetical protein TrVE_jg161 [Triparma verrucosa]